MKKKQNYRLDPQPLSHPSAPQTIYAVLGYLRYKGQTLMLHRNKKVNDVHEGKWNGLGGKMCPGETPEMTLHREIKEESGFTVEKAQFKGMITFPVFTPGQNWVVYIFVITNFSGKQLPTCNEGDLHWIDNDNILDLNLWEGDKLFLKWMQKNSFFSAKMDYVDGKLKQHQVTFY